MSIAERRKGFRLALPECSVSGSGGNSGRILDVSTSGLRVEMDTRCVFARGELHRLVLSDSTRSVEVEGTVRWTQSNWRDQLGSQDSDYVQTAGLTLSKLLTDEPSGIWSSLLAEVPLVETPPKTTRRPTPALRLMEPIDGASVSQESVNVICIIEDPKSVVGFSINGIEAAVMNDLGSARVPLNPGANKIVSVVRKVNGSYSTYRLGKIKRTGSDQPVT